MDIPPPPSISISQHTRRSRSPTPRSSAQFYASRQRSPSIPMSIPTRGRDNSPPPPSLAPPRDVQESTAAHESAAAGWQWTTNPHWQGFASERPSCGKDVARSQTLGEEPDDVQLDIDPTRRPSSVLTVTPAGGDVNMSGEAESLTDENRRLSVLSSEYRYDISCFLSRETDSQPFAYIKP